MRIGVEGEGFSGGWILLKVLARAIPHSGSQWGVGRVEEGAGTETYSSVIIPLAPTGMVTGEGSGETMVEKGCWTR